MPSNLYIKGVKKDWKVFSFLWLYWSPQVPVSRITALLVHVCTITDHITMAQSFLRLSFLIPSLNSRKPETIEYFQPKHRDFAWADFRTVILWIIKCNSYHANLSRRTECYVTVEKPFPPLSLRFLTTAKDFSVSSTGELLGKEVVHPLKLSLMTSCILTWHLLWSVVHIFANTTFMNNRYWGLVNE